MINPEAVAKTVSLKHLQDAASACPSTRKLLRLHCFGTRAKLRQVFAQFQMDPINLDITTFIGFINLLNLFGVSPISPPNIISCFADEIINGWLIGLPRQDMIEETFQYWMFKFCSDESRPPPEDSIIKEAKDAFREGIMSGVARLTKNKSARPIQA
jgi:hypothetical protein